MDIVCVDYPVMDFLIQVNKIPPSNGAGSFEQVSWQGGGNGSTAIVAAARLGAKTGMVGIVGNDQYGRCCINDFKRHGVDISHIAIDEKGSTAFCICLAETSTKMRTFIGSQDSCRQMNPNELDKEYITSAKYLHIARLDEAAIEAAKIAKDNGVKVSIDAGRYDPLVIENIALFDVFIASEFFYEGIFDNKDYKNNCAELQGMGPEIVVVTLGANGCVGIQNGNYFEIPTFNEVRVVDTTGAGDVFHGAFIYGLLQGWDAEKAAIFSNAVSSIKCTRLGGRTAIPDRKMVDRFLLDRYIEFSVIEERAKFYSDGLSLLGAINS
jgi:sulfofructose kinase